MIKQLVTIFTIGLMLAGCGALYVGPTQSNQIFTERHNVDTNELLKKAKRVLMMKDYSIQSYDNESGLISTSIKKYKLSVNQADCGTTMGIDYLKDYRTQTQVAINIFIDDKSITVKTMIDGYYKPGAAEQDIDLTCISKGTIERDILRDIL
mgnify:CR=1 FL=1